MEKKRKRKSKKKPPKKTWDYIGFEPKIADRYKKRKPPTMSHTQFLKLLLRVYKRSQRAEE